MTYAAACAFGNMYLICSHDQTYQSGTLCSAISFLNSGHSLHFPLATVPLRTRSIIVKDSSLSIPLLIRYVMISSRVQIAVEIVALPLRISSWALFSHTSVPCDSPEIRIRSEIVFGFVSTTIWITKSVPNSGIPRHPTGHPPISSGVIPSADVSWNSEITP